MEKSSEGELLSRKADTVHVSVPIIIPCEERLGANSRWVVVHALAVEMCGVIWRTTGGGCGPDNRLDGVAQTSPVECCP
jgi:hypothetical protein